MTAVYTSLSNASDPDRGGGESMIQSQIRALYCAVIVAVACVASYAREPAVLPPLGPGLGRVVIYRPWHYAASSTGAAIALNGELVGVCRAHKYFYTDTKPGAYYLHAYWLTFGDLGNFAQHTFTVRTGQTVFIRLNIGMSYSIEEPAADKAMHDLASMRYDPSAINEKELHSAKLIKRASLDFAQYNHPPAINSAPALQAASAPAGVPAPGAPPVYASPAAAGSMASGTRASLVVIAHCAKDPDFTGMFNPNFYSDCKQKEMNQIRSWIAGALAAHGIQATDANSAADYQFAVTITRDLDKRPMGLLTDFASGTAVFEATYQVLDPAGHVLGQGTVSHQGPDKHPDDIEKQFAQKIAASLATAPAENSSAASAAMPTQNAGALDPVKIVSADNLYAIVAQAYRSLPSKPPASDNARAENRKATDLMAAGNFKAAAGVYISILKTDEWWPEAFRGLALALGQSGSPDVAIIWMRRYLAFEPNAGDAAEMQAMIDAWTRQSPPRPTPVVTAAPGMHLGVSVVDTPGIVATALGQPDLEGALIDLVFPGSAAEKAALRKGDIVLDFNGAPVHSAKGFLADVARVAPGVPTPVLTQHGSTRRTVIVTLQ